MEAAAAMSSVVWRSRGPRQFFPQPDHNGRADDDDDASVKRFRLSVGLSVGRPLAPIDLGVADGRARSSFRIAEARMETLKWQRVCAGWDGSGSRRRITLARRRFHKRTDLNLSPEHVRRPGHRPTPLWWSTRTGPAGWGGWRIDQFLVLLLSRRNRNRVQPTNRPSGRPLRGHWFLPRMHGQARPTAVSFAMVSLWDSPQLMDPVQSSCLKCLFLHDWLITQRCCCICGYRLMLQLR